MTRYHFIGIGGAGLSPIARFLLEKGHQVSGSDLNQSSALQELEKLGVAVSIGHKAHQIEGADVIIRSSAVPETNIEVQAGMKAGIPIKKRRDFLSELTTDKTVIAIAGTHGKTTTTAMISWCLNQLGLDPSFIIGGTAKNLGTNAHAGTGEYFVIEADEYDRMFLGLSPTILVVTNIEHDHPDHFPTETEYFDAFLELTNRILPSGKLLVCGDHPGAARLSKNSQGVFAKFSYGMGSACNYIIENIRHQPRCGVKFNFVVADKTINKSSEPVTLSLSGEHNALNAGAALAVIHLLSQQLQAALPALQIFSGTGRRFDILGEAGGVVIIDDYAHHPSEIRATLAAARCRFPDHPIWCVWQPHTYSRTKELAQDFADAFVDCDHVIVTDIFASREKEEDFNSREVVKVMRHTDARHISGLAETSRFLAEELESGDILLVLSAGDADQISRDVLAQLVQKEKRNHG